MTFDHFFGLKMIRPLWTAGLLLAASTCTSPVHAYSISGTKWGSPIMGTGASVTWSLMGNSVPCSAEFSGCTINSFSGFTAQIQSALSSWSSVANISFTQVSDNGLPFNAPGATLGQIRIGQHYFDGALGVLAHAYIPTTANTAAGDIHFDQDESWASTHNGNPSAIQVLNVAAHEVGHAIGILHSSINAALMYPYYNESVAAPTSDDIAAAQFIYGPRTPTTPTCNLPSSVGVVHLDLVPGDGCLILNGGSSVGRVFTDNLFSLGNWAWQSQYQNITTGTKSFVARWTWPTGSITKRITLPANQVFSISIPFKEVPETGAWRWFASNGLAYPLGIDTAVQESTPFANRLCDPSQSECDDVYASDLNQDWIGFSDPVNSLIEDTIDPPDIFIGVDVPGPIPILGVMALARLSRRFRRLSSRYREHASSASNLFG
jgi:hypothetical protein